MTPRDQITAFEKHVKLLNKDFDKNTSSLKGLFEHLETLLSAPKKDPKKTEPDPVAPSVAEKIVRQAKVTEGVKYEVYKPAIDEICRVFGRGWDYQSDFLVKFDKGPAKAAAERIKYLTKNLHETDQSNHGCCGLTGALMALLQHTPGRVDELYRCMTRGERFLDIPKSERIIGRLQKRIDDGLFSADGVSALDAQLSLALLILLKETMKDKKPALWDQANEFSKAWPTWSPGVPVGKGQQQPTEFSYKNGDMGLPAEGAEFLFQTLGFKTTEVRPLLTNKVLEENKEEKKFRAILGEGSFQKTLTQLVTDASSKFSGALLGVTLLSSIVKPEEAKVASKFGYLGHWVYLPKQSVPKDVTKIETWTWGKKHTVQELLDHQFKMIPSVALLFKAP